MTSLKPITLQLRLDAARTITLTNVFAGFLLPLVLSFVVSFFSEPSFVAMLNISFFSFISLSYGLSASVAEGVNDHRNINGVIPVSRARQVIGRYAFTFLSILVSVISISLCWLFARFVAQRPWPGSLGLVCSLTALIALIAAVIVLPLFYAWRPDKVMQIFGLTLMVIGLSVGALTSLLPDNFLQTLSLSKTWAVTHPQITSGLIVIACVLLTYASIMLSIHLLKRRQY